MGKYTLEISMFLLNKSKLSINNGTRNEIFSVLASEIKKIELDGIQYDMLQQADKHRVGFKIATAKNAIESRKRHTSEKVDVPELFKEKKKIQEGIAKTVIDDTYDKKNKKNTFRGR